MSWCFCAVLLPFVRSFSSHANDGEIAATVASGCSWAGLASPSPRLNARHKRHLAKVTEVSGTRNACDTVNLV